jgi:proteasome lid subunit RPN8/RPN11
VSVSYLIQQWLSTNPIHPILKQKSSAIHAATRLICIVLRHSLLWGWIVSVDGGEIPIGWRQLLTDFWRAVERRTQGVVPPTLPTPSPTPLAPLQKLILSDDVSRTLFSEYAQHRQTERGSEETGWVLLGLRRGDEAVALATLPAGAGREADEVHVRFNSAAQAFASRIVRQQGRQLSMIGVVHTHPGSLRHPSSADYRGDIQWVANLRGGEGVFGIGTADAELKGESVGWQPFPNVQCLGKLRLSWYVLGSGDRNYRPISVELVLGPDLGTSLRPVWDEIETHAERLDSLSRQLAQIRYDVVSAKERPTLSATIPLTDGKRSIEVHVQGKAVRYYLHTSDGPLAADFHEDRIDVGVYLMLSELAATI